MKLKITLAVALLLLTAGNTLAMHQQIGMSAHNALAPHYHTADGTAHVKTSVTAK